MAADLGKLNAKLAEQAYVDGWVSLKTTKNQMTLWEYAYFCKKKTKTIEMSRRNVLLSCLRQLEFPNF